MLNSQYLFLQGYFNSLMKKITTRGNVREDTCRKGVTFPFPEII